MISIKDLIIKYADDSDMFGNAFYWEKNAGHF